MKVACDVILDLIPLVKDNAASDESVKLVSMHLESCESCRIEFNNYRFSSDMDIDDQKVLNSVKKRLFVVISGLMLVGTIIGMVLNNNDPMNYLTLIVSVLTVLVIGLLIFKVELKGAEGMKRFFIGRAIGTIIVFTILGIYLLVKYVILG